MVQVARVDGQIAVGEWATDGWRTNDWRTNAACRDTDPALFFPIGTTGPAVDQVRSAKEVCVGCPARDACLEFAIATNQDAGVWGGTSEEERRVMRRHLRDSRAS